MEGQGLTITFGVVNAAESSRQVTPDDSSQTGSAGWCLPVYGISLQDGWGGCHWMRLLSMRVPPGALAENIKGPKSQEIQQTPSLLSPITFMIFS